MIIRVASDERHPAYYAAIGWALHSRGWRLRSPPAIRRHRAWVVRLRPPAERSCPGRYALLLGAAALAGRALQPVGHPVPSSVTFWCPAELLGEGTDIRARAVLGLRRISLGQTVVVPDGPRVRVHVALPQGARTDLLRLGRPRSHWLRAALAAARPPSSARQ